MFVADILYVRAQIQISKNVNSQWYDYNAFYNDVKSEVLQEDQQLVSKKSKPGSVTVIYQ